MRRRVVTVGGVVALGLLALVIVLGVHDVANVRWGGEGGGSRTMPETLRDRLTRVANRSTLRLVHRGRKSGQAYEVTIWFVVDGETVYLTTMDTRRQWVRNVAQTPMVQLQIGPERFAGTVTRVTAVPEKEREYGLLTRKYWIMRLMDGALRLAGRDPGVSIERGRGGYFRVDLAPAVG